MLIALEDHLGVVTNAARDAGIDRKTHYRWYESDPEYKEAVDDLQNVVLDFSEAKLFNRIEKEDTTAIIFHLKTKGKKRGYIEKVETGFTNAQGQDVLPQIVLQPAPNCEPVKEE